VLERVLARLPLAAESVSFTTRAPRAYETPGSHYHFLSPAQFQLKAQAGHFLEHAQIHAHSYGTCRHALQALRDSGRLPFLCIDIEGAIQVHRQQADSCLYIFLMPPDPGLWRNRLSHRGS
jgi:guanylate kinase